MALLAEGSTIAEMLADCHLCSNRRGHVDAAVERHQGAPPKVFNIPTISTSISAAMQRNWCATWVLSACRSDAIRAAP